MSRFDFTFINSTFIEQKKMYFCPLDDFLSSMMFISCYFFAYWYN